MYDSRKAAMQGLTSKAPKLQNPISVSSMLGTAAAITALNLVFVLLSDPFLNHLLCAFVSFCGVVLLGCKCGGPVRESTLELMLTKQKCELLDAPEGSCDNRVTCPRADGTCGINVYGHRGTDNGVTCRVSCAKMGLQCVSVTHLQHRNPRNPRAQ